MSTDPRLPLCVSFALLAAAAAGAQDPTPPAQTPREAAIAEFRELALQQARPGPEQTARNEALKAWLAKVEGVDLGEWSFARAIAGYFNRDPKAPQQLLDYWKQSQKLPSKEFDTLAGRLFMTHAVQAIRSGDVEAARDSSTLAVDLYKDLPIVYGAIGRGLKEAKGEAAPAAAALLADLEKRLASDERLSAEQKETIRGRIHATAAAAGRERPRTIEPFQTVDMDGKPIALADYHGKVVLVDFWATWCAPCLREMPNVVAAYQKHHAQGFEVIGVSLDEANAAETIREVTNRLGMTWRQIYDGKKWQADLVVRNGIKGIPATFLFDRSGKCRESGLRGEQLGAAVEKLLAEPAPAKTDK